MKPLFTLEGRAALAAMVRARPLLAFDFDGTLAPIVARPHDARTPLAVARRLARLAEAMPVAVITGRTVADVSTRLGFAPRFIVGSHGMEDAGAPLSRHWAEVLDPLRTRLKARRGELARYGVTVEDKHFSLALHYRLAPNPERAREAIEAALRETVADVGVGEGKCVVNVVPRGAPDKGDALLTLAVRCGADAGLFVGDDDNDEAAFAKAPPGWVTVRVGPAPLRSRAAYYLDGPTQLPSMLQTLLESRAAP